MMSQHGYQPSFRNPLHSDGTMDLYIETLTGTAFEMTVSPFDTVISIKSKIQRVEGIPVSHQHLLYNMHELDDSACLMDYSIQDGATLKLVLSMRGGPISTRRLPLGEDVTWKEQLRELVEGSRDEVNDRLPPGARVTVFVFGEKNQLSLVRVIENDDGSYTPLSESWSGSSIRNLFAEEDPDESNKRLQENSVTMGKMQELQHKMETLTMQKKPKTNEERFRSPPLLQLPPINLNPSPASYLATSSLVQPARLSRRETKPDASGRRPGRGGGLLSRENLPKNLPREREVDQRENVTITKTGNSGRYRLSRFFLEDSQDRPKTSPDNLTKQQKAAQEICDILSETKWHRHTRQARIPCSNTQLLEPMETTQLDFSRGEASGLDVAIRSPRYGRRGIVLPAAVRPECGQEKHQTHEIYHPTMLNDEEKQESLPRLPSSIPSTSSSDVELLGTGAIPKKTSSIRTRCAQCKKRLNITNIYTCRCNLIFCSAHRHCESHHCTFDYKTHGRKLLEAANPVVSAPKLPKM